MEDVSRYVKAYRDLRDKKGALDAAYKTKMAPLDEMMDKIENHLLALANEQGVQSFATEHGTAYKHTATYCKVEDWGAFQTSLVKQMTIAIDAAMPCDDEDKASCHVRLKVSQGAWARAGCASECREAQNQLLS